MDLVLLPGMMCDARLFGPQRDAFPNSIVITSTDHTSIKDMAKDVLDQAPDTFALAGLSMGGIVAMEVIRFAPDRVTQLALMDTNHRAERAVVKEKRWPQIAAVQEGRLTDVVRDEMKPQYLVDSAKKPAILDLCMAMATDLGPQVFVNQSHALMNRPDQTETLRTVTCPSLVLCGAHDQLCPVSTHQGMAALLPNATLTLIENAGHLPTLEQPMETNTALRRWLEAS